MVMRTGRWRRASIAGGLAVLVALPVLGGSAGAISPRSPSGTNPPTETWSLNVFGSGPIKGIAMIESGSPGRIRYAFHGLPSTGELRAVASTKPCAQAHTTADKVLGFSLSSSTPGSTAASQFALDIDGGTAGFIRSLRIYRGAGTGDQRACSRSTGWTTGSTAFQPTLTDILVSSYFKAPGPRGLITVGVVDADTVQVRAELLHTDRGSFRLVGSTKPCSEAQTGSARAFAVDYNLGDTATHEVGHFVSATGTLATPADSIRSVRLLRRSGGTFQPVECRGIIAVLIGL